MSIWYQTLSTHGRALYDLIISPIVKVKSSLNNIFHFKGKIDGEDFTIKMSPLFIPISKIGCLAFFNSKELLRFEKPLVVNYYITMCYVLTTNLHKSLMEKAGRIEEEFIIAGDKSEGERLFIIRDWEIILTYFWNDIYKSENRYLINLVKVRYSTIGYEACSRLISIKSKDSLKDVIGIINHQLYSNFNNNKGDLEGGSHFTTEKDYFYALNVMELGPKVDQPNNKSNNDMTVAYPHIICYNSGASILFDIENKEGCYKPDWFYSEEGPKSYFPKNNRNMKVAINEKGERVEIDYSIRTPKSYDAIYNQVRRKK